MIAQWWERRAARRAIERFYGVPYLRELSAVETRGMLQLEALGEVARDPSDYWSRVHWHVRTPR